MTSKPPSTTLSNPNPPTALPWLFAAVSFIGFLDAAYLTANHYFGIPLVCSVIQGCERVTTSAYSTVFGVPVALLGALYYVIIFFLTVWYIDSRRLDVFFTAARMTSVGMIASLWFVSIQLFVLKAICIYCMTSALTSTILFAIGAYTLKRGWIRAE